MGRKNLFESVLAGRSVQPGAEAASKSTPALPGNRGAVGVVSQTIQEMRAQGVLELETDLIDPSFVTDRIDVDPQTQAEFVALIREHGQQVPILVRPHPETPGRYQIVYGRRRLKAAAELGRPVRALVKKLSDEELVVAQGQENSARADLSFIERALFAATLEQRGFSRDTIMAALAVDKSGLSRLISVAVKIPSHIIEAIGPAPRTGRDPWGVLAAKMETPRGVPNAEALLRDPGFHAIKSSDERFARMLDHVTVKKKPPRPQPEIVEAADGRKLATVRRERGGTVMKFDDRAAPKFAAYLASQIPEIYAAWKSDADE